MAPAKLVVALLIQMANGLVLNSQLNWVENQVMVHIECLVRRVSCCSHLLVLFWLSVKLVVAFSFFTKPASNQSFDC